MDSIFIRHGTVVAMDDRRRVIDFTDVYAGDDWCPENLGNCEGLLHFVKFKRHSYPI